MILQGNMENINISKIEILTDHVLVHVFFDGVLEVVIQEIPDVDFGL